MKMNWSRLLLLLLLLAAAVAATAQAAAPSAASISITKVAVVVETRYTPSLLYVLQQANINLPHNQWDIVLLTNQRVADQYHQELATTSDSTIIVKTILKDSLDRHGYNTLIKSRKLYATTLSMYNYILFFQTDTTFCRPFVDTTFFQTGYVGSVWDTVTTPTGFACAALRDRSLPRARKLWSSVFPTTRSVY